MPEIKQHVWLCGFMGCGKSTVGKLLAKLCGVQFYDMDHFIEQKTGMRIPDIFAGMGESYFRKLENQTITELCASPPCVVATGGGAMVSAKNAAEAKKNNGVIVFLDIPFETCYDRIQYSDRPIVQNSTQEKLRQLYLERRTSYTSHADIVFGQVLSPMETAQELAYKIALS